MDTELIFTGYKEPLRPVPGGHGYMGCLAMTKDGTLVQCHVCGTLVANLGIHVYNNHKMPAWQYKEKYGLAAQTALASEAFRYKMKRNLLAFWAGKTKAQRTAHSRHASSFVVSNNIGKKHSLETKNKRGYCPDQILQKIMDCKKELGRTPALGDIRRYARRRHMQGLVRLIYHTFGSWNNALVKAGMQVNAVQPKRTKTDAELLQALKDFYKVHKQVPTQSDARRGFIPSAGMYQNRFGGMVAARGKAGLPLYHPKAKYRV